MSILSATILLFLVIDPVGNIPFPLTALKDVEPARQLRVVVRELLVALAVLVAFLIAGRSAMAALIMSSSATSRARGPRSRSCRWEAYPGLV
ncbi:MAG: MarC family protein [Longimicrobiales bacterium]|nr:MarC family protein [Longimicrobiales bacterium]